MAMIWPRTKRVVGILEHLPDVGNAIAAKARVDTQGVVVSDNYPLPSKDGLAISYGAGIGGLESVKIYQGVSAVTKGLRLGLPTPA